MRLVLDSAARHAVGDVVRRMDQRGSGARAVNWLAATVRHEIAPPPARTLRSLGDSRAPSLGNLDPDINREEPCGFQNLT